MIKEQISFPGPQQLKVETKGIFKQKEYLKIVQAEIISIKILSQTT